ARREYEERIRELQHDVDDARADHDTSRAERAELELDALVEQLSDAFGLGGRARPTGSSAERARTAVTFRMRSAIRKLSEVHPELGRHLTNAVRTGTWCAYRPEHDVTWTVLTV
ncbi:MAG: transcriptional regulator, partial [Ilumatobacteraceae bacterium]